MKKTLKMMVNACLIAVMILSMCAPVLAEEVASGPVQMVQETPASGSDAAVTPEPAAEPTAEPTVEPVAEPTVEPVTEPTVEPAAEETAELAAEETTEPAAEETAEPVVEETAEPAAEETAEPAVEETAEPAAEETTEPAVEESAEPAAEATAEPTGEPAAEPTPVAFTGTVTVYLENTGDIYYGDIITLRAEIKDANLPYSIRWEANDGDGWKAIPDENGEKFEFEVDEENAAWEYRVVLITID